MPGVMRMRSMALVFLIILLLITYSSSSSSYTNNNNSISSIRCKPEESSALIGFKNSIETAYCSKIRSWKKGTDCCGWDGIMCDPISHYVVDLNLIMCGLVGTLNSNSSLFHLHHLIYLDLSMNSFSQSTISPMFGSSFPLLKSLNLGHSNFSGEVPFKITQLSKLQYLNLIDNNNGLLKMKMSTFHNIISNMTQLSYLYLTGVNIDSTIPPSLTNLSSLQVLDLSNCNLRGELPANVLNLPQLREINLGGNHHLHANFILSNWNTSLNQIDLSNVNFSSKLPSSPVLSQYNQLFSLRLRGCSFHGQIPDWVWDVAVNQNICLDMFVLDLSDNMFNGSINFNEIQSNFQNLNITSDLSYLDISHNFLTGMVTSLPWNCLRAIDLSYNMFNGPLFIPSIESLSGFLASNNNFMGPLPSSLCNLTYLHILDLSNNSLTGEVPRCLGNLSYYLTVLNLGSNNIFGTFPDAIISNCSSLEYLDLSFNLLEGLVPQLLTRCKRLEVLNLRGNKLRDEFPHWLGSLPYILVLDLSNNGFFGPLPPLDASIPFLELQVLDLSNNNFSGKIPIGFLERFKAMMITKRNVEGLEYMETIDNYANFDYYYSITLIFNSVVLNYEKIITTLTIFDLSNNKFEGEIPHNIGKLISLHGLNLSHNQINGPIPPSLGNLTLLNCLDLSSNKLTGKIPQELTSLSSLGIFNVSENKLEGPIPNDNHFETFPVNSYKGNPALCGIPLPKCGEHGRPRPHPSKNDNKEVDEGMVSEWKVVMLGCGFGTFVSFAWGCYMLSIGRPLWLLKLVLILVDLLEKRLFGRRRRRPARGSS